MELARKTDETDHPWGLFKKKKERERTEKGIKEMETKEGRRRTERQETAS